MRYVAVALCLLLPGVARAGEIEILQSQYGDVLSAEVGKVCDATEGVRAECEGRAQCAVTASPMLCGDPAPGSFADRLTVNYQCAPQSPPDLDIAPEGTTAELDCPDAAGAAHARKSADARKKIHRVALAKHAPARRSTPAIHHASAVSSGNTKLPSTAPNPPPAPPAGASR